MMLTSIFLLSVIFASIGVYLQWDKQQFVNKTYQLLQQKPDIIDILQGIDKLSYTITSGYDNTTVILTRNGNNYNMTIKINENQTITYIFTLSGHNITNITQYNYTIINGTLNTTSQTIEPATFMFLLTGEYYEVNAINIAPGTDPGLLGREGPSTPPEVLYPFYVFYLSRITFNQTGYVDIVRLDMTKAQLNGKQVLAGILELKPKDYILQARQFTWDANQYNITYTIPDNTLLALNITIVNLNTQGFNTPVQIQLQTYQPHTS